MPRTLRRPALLALAAGAFVADWVAVAADNRKAELVAKSVSMPALTLAGVESGMLERPWGRQVVAGQAFGFVGDVCLLREEEHFFLGGLSAFLVGHVGYIAAFRRMGLRRTPWVLPGVAALAGCMWWSRDALPNLWREGGAAAAGPVAAYMGVIGAMSLAAWSTGNPVTGAGASLFVISDTVIAVNAFVEPLEQPGLKIMVPYLVGQALIAAGAVTHPES
jgi:uncharacterized membrane protein YhhN